VGLLNNILGTFLLTALTLFLALLPGVGAGVFMSEYPGRIASAIDFCTQMLRAVSMFVIGAAAFGVVKLMNTWDPGSLLSQFVRGSYTDPVSGFAAPDRGSFLLAAAVLALLVMPIIAKLTEEGLRSVPRDIREGSIALGAVEGHGLRRILLPWAAPNIVTALVLAAAEANGSLAAIVFLEGIGERGVGLANGVTSLDYVVFATKYGPTLYAHTMDGYRLTAALVLLVLTLGLTVLAMVLQRRFARRYRGSITSN
jgi:ABC-type phosphate transport system permease subunit